MKKAFSLSLNVAAFFMLCGIARADIVISKQYPLSGLSVEEYTDASSGRTYERLNLKGCFEPGDSAGHPELPYAIVRLALPANQGLSSVKISQNTFHELTGEFDVFPIQKPLFIGGKSRNGFIGPDSTIYGSSKTMPGRLFDVVGDGYMAGFHLLTLKLYPVQYSPRLKKVTLYDNIEITVRLSPRAENAVPVLQRNANAQRSIESMIRLYVDNPQDIETFRPACNLRTPEKSRQGSLVKPFAITSLPSLESYPVDYLVITTDELTPAFEALASWKTKKGIMAQVRTTGWIDANYNGCDLQEKIRNFIKDAYSHWGTVFVLFGGEHSLIPIRYGYAAGGYGAQSTITTDLYFSSLEGNWNANGNNVFGEIGTGEWQPTDPDYLYVSFFDQTEGLLQKPINVFSYTIDAGVQW